MLPTNLLPFMNPVNGMILTANFVFIAEKTVP
jgi:hypothetical protein